MVKDAEEVSQVLSSISLSKTKSLGSGDRKTTRSLPSLFFFQGKVSSNSNVKADKERKNPMLLISYWPEVRWYFWPGKMACLIFGSIWYNVNGGNLMLIKGSGLEDNEITEEDGESDECSQHSKSQVDVVIESRFKAWKTNKGTRWCTDR